MTTSITKYSRLDITNRIERLKTKPIINANLIKKWERILRKFDESNA